MSEFPREEDVRDANVLARVLKMLVFDDADGANEDGEGRGREFMEGEIGAELSD